MCLQGVGSLEDNPSLRSLGLTVNLYESCFEMRKVSCEKKKYISWNFPFHDSVLIKNSRKIILPGQSFLKVGKRNPREVFDKEN